MFPPVDTKNPTAVAAYIEATFSRLYPASESGWLRRILRDVEALFGGYLLGYAPCDVRYHDFEHTLQTTVCVAQLLAGRHGADVDPKLSAHDHLLAISAALLHDTGYLKPRGDTAGTGAKYTYCHVLRSCALAASYLPSVGASADDVEVVLGAITCTGPAKQVRLLQFRHPVHRIIGCAVATADYLGQMAAADYPDELGLLFEEFNESDEFLRLPPAQRLFTSAAQLVERTPLFWRRVVRPKLEEDFGGLFRFLGSAAESENPYLQAIERNIALVEARLHRSETCSPSGAMR